MIMILFDMFSIISFHVTRRSRYLPVSLPLFCTLFALTSFREEAITIAS